MTGIDAPWLHDPDAASVMTALTASGGAGAARFVGGCVRDALVGRSGGDVDVATVLTPDATLAALKAAGIKAVPTGLAHGTVTAVAGGKPFEVTTLRRDVETDGRRAVVAFTRDWTEDAARRDFHLNALYADILGQVLDPTGRGVDDARAGRVVFVGDARRRIAEDHLRILRFFRFFAWFGKDEPDPEGLAACAHMAEGVDRLSAERVSAELLKLLAAPDPTRAMTAMDGANVLTRVLGTAGDIARLGAIVPLTDDPVLRLSALFADDAVMVGARARTLRLPNAVTTRLVAAAQRLGLDGMTDRKARALTYALGGVAVADRTLKALAADPARGREAETALAVARTWTPPRMPVGGRQVARLDVPPGPETGAVLKAFERAWIEADFSPDGSDARLAEAVRAVRGSAR